MKKQSVLIQRALIFTAIVALVAVAAGLPVYMLACSRFAVGAAREAVLPEARTLAEAADDPAGAAFKSELKMLEHTGGAAWLVSPAGTSAVTADGLALPEEVALLTADALIGYEYLGETRVGGQTCAFAITPVIDSEGKVQAAVIAALPARAGEHPLVSALLGLLTGLLAAGLTAAVLVNKLLVPVVKPITKLRDVAVAVAEGHFDVRASERAPGEIGQLGKAINNVSKQLSRSMYSLILERNRLRHMLDGLSEGIVAIDEEGRVTHTNPALDRMFTKQKAIHLPDPRMKIIPDETIWRTSTA